MKALRQSREMLPNVQASSRSELTISCGGEQWSELFCRSANLCSSFVNTESERQLAVCKAFVGGASIEGVNLRR